MTDGDDAVRFTFVVKPEHWEEWMEGWTPVVESVEAHIPFLREYALKVILWMYDDGMSITDPQMMAWIAFRRDETTSDESWLTSRLSGLQM